ncbi:hypothetical protein CBR_g50122 [Chara braunii]|uniref:U-box domain-containing protein 12 n=1 Tax=Chara braunii TaxID=69332 RepID=A0A388M6B9_CHABU|nr:hypothetical protein CBR_g50122 [Chara braunii]|eukprot:GBG90029.1 hypothetical protein CBR_g50122 [Chara braunii]
MEAGSAQGSGSSSSTIPVFAPPPPPPPSTSPPPLPPHALVHRPTSFSTMSMPPPPPPFACVSSSSAPSPMFLSSSSSPSPSFSSSSSSSSPFFSSLSHASFYFSSSCPSSSSSSSSSSLSVPITATPAAVPVGSAEREPSWLLVKQLIQLAKNVSKIAESTKSHKKFCVTLSRRVKNIVPFLEELRDLRSPLPPAATASFKALEISFRKAKTLLEECRDGSRMFMVLNSEAMLIRFHDLTAEICGHLYDVPLNILEISDETKEQVELVREQLRRAKSVVDLKDSSLFSELRNAMEGVRKGGTWDGSRLTDLARGLELNTRSAIQAEMKALERRGEAAAAAAAVSAAGGGGGGGGAVGGGGGGAIRSMPPVLGGGLAGNTSGCSMSTGTSGATNSLASAGAAAPGGGGGGGYSTLGGVVNGGAGAGGGGGGGGGGAADLEDAELKLMRALLQRMSMCSTGMEPDSSDLVGCSSSASTCPGLSSHKTLPPVPPDDFRCPISLELMSDPVIISTGQTFDRACIQRWIDSGHRTCPKTQQPLSHFTLIPNYVLKGLIIAWCEENGVEFPQKKGNQGRGACDGGEATGDRTLVDGLLVKLRHGTGEEQRNATGELRLLAKRSMENRVCIAQAGAIPILVHLLSSADPKTREHAVTALLNLSINESNKGAIMSAGAVQPIVEVLKSGTMEARENAAATLFSLSAVSDNKAPIGAAGAIPALVGLLQEGGTRGKRDAATALFNLTVAPVNKTRAVRAGIIPPLMELLTDRTMGLVDEALAILSVLVTAPEGREAVGQAAAVPILVDLIKDGTPRNKENAAAILLALCLNNAVHKEEVLKLGAGQPLSNLLLSGTARARRKAKDLLSHLQASSGVTGGDRDAYHGAASGANTGQIAEDMRTSR